MHKRWVWEIKWRAENVGDIGLLNIKRALIVADLKDSHSANIVNMDAKLSADILKKGVVAIKRSKGVAVAINFKSVAVATNK
jgi:hypothetical protein